MRGYTLLACVCDEIAFWRSEDSANPDKEIIAGVRPGLASIPSSLLLCISSPYARRGALWNTYSRHLGRDDSPILVWQAASRSMNPSLPQSVVDQAMEEDEASARAEYLAEFRKDVESFVNLEALNACVVQGRQELVPGRFSYFGFTDPSGGSSDSMTLGIAHEHRREGGAANTFVLDLVRERRPPFSPDDVVREFAETLKRYGIEKVEGDRYAGEWPRERFRQHGIEYETSERSKSEIYREMLPLLNSSRVDLLDSPRLISQLLNLERRTGSTGRDIIDHPPNAHDDVINAAAGALLAAAGPTPASQYGGIF